MPHLTHLKQKAIILRTEQNYSLDDIASRLGVPRTTVYGWIKDIPIPRTQKQTKGQRMGTASMVAKYAVIRQQAYTETYEGAAELLADREIRDFVVLYLAEGYRKDKNRVSVTNSNPHIICVSYRCMRRLSTKGKYSYSFLYHADQDVDELKRFWSDYLDISPAEIKAFKKSNSGMLAHRQWASLYGVFMVGVNDTILRSRLQALMDTIQEQWAAQLLD